MVNGERFLALNSCEAVRFTGHARTRFAERARGGICPFCQDELLRNASYIKAEELTTKGYIPGKFAPKHSKCENHYFISHESGSEIVFVITKRIDEPGYCCVTVLTEGSKYDPELLARLHTNKASCCKAALIKSARKAKRREKALTKPEPPEPAPKKKGRGKSKGKGKSKRKSSVG